MARPLSSRTSFWRPCRRCGSAISRCAWPATSIGIAGKIADTFNEIVAANQRMAQQLERVGQVVGREGKTRQRVKFGLSERRLGRDGKLGQHPDRRPAVADHAR